MAKFESYNPNHHHNYCPSLAADTEMNMMLIPAIVGAVDSN